FPSVVAIILSCKNRTVALENGGKNKCTDKVKDGGNGEPLHKVHESGVHLLFYTFLRLRDHFVDRFLIGTEGLGHFGGRIQRNLTHHIGIFRLNPFGKRGGEGRVDDHLYEEHEENIAQSFAERPITTYFLPQIDCEINGKTYTYGHGNKTKSRVCHQCR